MGKILDSLIQRRQMKKAERQYDAEGRARGPGKYTATQTGARALAEARRDSKPGIGDFVTRASKAPTPKGATPQFRPVDDTDIEDMISGKKRGGK